MSGLHSVKPGKNIIVITVIIIIIAIIVIITIRIITICQTRPNMDSFQLMLVMVRLFEMLRYFTSMRYYITPCISYFIVDACHGEIASNLHRAAADRYHVPPFSNNVRIQKHVQIQIQVVVFTELQIDIKFPTCWDGVNLEAKDGQEHVVYR